MSAAPLKDIGISRGAYWMMLKRIAVLAGCIDVFYLVLFWLLDMPALALINVVSMAIYAAAFVLIDRRRNLAAVVLMWGEVLVHSTVCTLLLGWNSGIHYFLLVFLPALALSRSDRQASGLLLFLVAWYFALDWACSMIAPTYILSPGLETAMRWLAIGLVFSMFGYTGRYYAQVVGQAERKLRRIATIDPLSGMSNRRFVMEMAVKEMLHASRQHLPLTFVLADIDHFKLVNDTYGHEAGDRVIQHVAAVFQARLRRSDIGSRWGGEEFLLVLPATDSDGALGVCEQIRRHLEANPCEYNGVKMAATMSFGIYCAQPDDSVEYAIRQADGLVYEAKHAGRNRCVTQRPVTEAAKAAQPKPARVA